ncbi:hypothetical protein DL766_005273 [Monosporascus sp. MC13-8B]|nr:hypothetical protein DL763_006203 [Monosporascus cannonballus]RYP29643.1 hypothetical protein DL766_005273 [Monosporascus sp. MC13-8B]
MSSTDATLPLPRQQRQYQHQHQHTHPPPPPPPPAQSPTRQRQGLSRSRKSGIAAASTPNLNSLYSLHSKLAPSLGVLGRKASFAALTPHSLAAIPDDSESYAIHSVLSGDDCAGKMMAPPTPGKGAGSDVAVGDTVDVPGNMSGTVRFVGSVDGKKGTFAGVELHPEFAARGKNSGDVDGISYFATTVPGSGIFVPITKLFRRDSPPTPASGSYPITPAGNPMSGLRVASQNATNYTPPTPSLPKFSQSVGPGRVPSPQGKRPRVSLPRPESPVRKLQFTPTPRSATATPAPKAPPRYGTPSIPKLGSSVYGIVGDPNKSASRLDIKSSLAPRSVSAMGQARSVSALGPLPNSGYNDEETTPIGPRTKTNGSIGSMSSMSSFRRPASRAAHANEEEVERLRAQLEDRDRQLKEQASALAEMESSLTELTDLMEQSDAARPARSNSLDGKDTLQLRALLREKNEKIAMLTAEFDAHRADFRSTIDTLEMASTETQRVYEAKIRELEQEVQEVQDRTVDVDSVARQLKQLEELVQELEEGLEDARRGEAEARGEVEFLRGEVERTRAELRKEREKASAAINGGDNAEDRPSMSKELEQKEDEIRGLKAIIHSLSRDSVPGDSPDRTPSQPEGSGPDSIDAQLVKEKLEREVFELRNLLETKDAREEELERQIETLRRGSVSNHRSSALTIRSADRSSYRDSKGTVVLPRELRSPELTHKRAQTLESMPEIDNYSSVTESSTLWCEICETNGHDILTCSNMFGSQQEHKDSATDRSSAKPENDATRDSANHLTVPADGPEEVTPRPLTPIKPKTTVSPLPEARVPATSLDSGPLAGKESGVVDLEKWCALSAGIRSFRALGAPAPLARYFKNGRYLAGLMHSPRDDDRLARRELRSCGGDEVKAKNRRRTGRSRRSYI